MLASLTTTTHFRAGHPFGWRPEHLAVVVRSCEVTAVRADWWVTVDCGEVASNVCWFYGDEDCKPLR